MADDGKQLDASHSYHIRQSPRPHQSEDFSKSDLNFTLRTSTATSKSSKDGLLKTACPSKSSQGEYYKKYEHDEIPVKDSDVSTAKYRIRKAKDSLTNSDLDNLERRIFKNVSQELQTEESSLSSLDSNIKFFKTTVEKIFDNFYSSMNDFEHYKKRFQEILSKSKEGSIADMEDFIKDMFEHIISSDNSASNITQHSGELAVANLEDKVVCRSSCGDVSIEPENAAGFVEAYKNENYLTDSTIDENGPKAKISSKIEEIFNIFLLGGSPCVQIKLNGRNLLSEINIKEPEKVTTSTASADNMKRLEAKKLEVEKYIKQNETDAPDREIPVKVSYAKKNIYLNEDFAHITESNESSKSFLTKLCNILCRRFRKTNFG